MNTTISIINDDGKIIEKYDLDPQNNKPQLQFKYLHISDLKEIEFNGEFIYSLLFNNNKKQILQEVYNNIGYLQYKTIYSYLYNTEETTIIYSNPSDLEVIFPYYKDDIKYEYIFNEHGFLGPTIYQKYNNAFKEIIDISLLDKYPLSTTTRDEYGYEIPSEKLIFNI